MFAGRDFSPKETLHQGIGDLTIPIVDIQFGCSIVGSEGMGIFVWDLFKALVVWKLVLRRRPNESTSKLFWRLIVKQKLWLDPMGLGFLLLQSNILI
jgi:hypothetical protein